MKTGHVVALLSGIVLGFGTAYFIGMKKANKGEKKSEFKNGDVVNGDCYYSKTASFGPCGQK